MPSPSITNTMMTAGKFVTQGMMINADPDRKMAQDIWYHRVFISNVLPGKDQYCKTLYLGYSCVWSKPKVKSVGDLLPE